MVEPSPTVDAMLSGWGGVSPTRAGVKAFRPDSPDELYASPGARGLLARGLGRSYGDAAQNAGGLVLDMTGATRMHQADMESGVVTAEAGVSLDSLVRKVLPWGWFPAVTPGTRFVTVGGAIAADVHGKNHHRDGGFSDFVDSMELHSPGRGNLTLTPADTPDEFSASAGGMGLTGVITAASLRMTRVQTAFMRVDTEKSGDIDDAMQRMESGDDRYQYSVAWVDCLARGRSLGRAVLGRANHATLDDLDLKRKADPLDFEARVKVRVPKGIPSHALGKAAARAFNEMWFRKARQEQGRLIPILPYFYPLDSVGDWNRLYGSRGFVQYQFVVPFGQEDIVRRVLGQLSAADCPSFLAVLKRFGPGHGLLSFPIPGWTLALDLPARQESLSVLLDGFDQMVAEAGGRIYLAKDSRMRPELVEQMYPELDRWREIRESLDPNRILNSDLNRRLRLADPAISVKTKGKR